MPAGRPRPQPAAQTHGTCTNRRRQARGCSQVCAAGGTGLRRRCLAAICGGSVSRPAGGRRIGKGLRTHLSADLTCRPLAGRGLKEESAAKPPERPRAPRAPAPASASLRVYSRAPSTYPPHGSRRAPAPASSPSHLPHPRCRAARSCVARARARGIRCARSSHPRARREGLSKGLAARGAQRASKFLSARQDREEGAEQGGALAEWYRCADCRPGVNRVRRTSAAVASSLDSWHKSAVLRSVRSTAWAARRTARSPSAGALVPDLRFCRCAHSARTNGNAFAAPIGCVRGSTRRRTAFLCHGFGKIASDCFACASPCARLRRGR